MNLMTELFLACLGDKDILVEKNFSPLRGLRILPLANNQLGQIGRISYYRTEDEETFLLPAMSDRFIYHSCGAQLGDYMAIPEFTSNLSIVPFTVQFLSQNIQTVIPPNWKNKLTVDFLPTDNSVPSTLWLQTFWKFIASGIVSYFTELTFLASTDSASFQTNIALFAEWPLIPLTDGKMCSPKLLQGVLLPVPDQEPNSEISLSLELLQNLNVYFSHKPSNLLRFLESLLLSLLISKSLFPRMGNTLFTFSRDSITQAFTLGSTWMLSLNKIDICFSAILLHILVKIKVSIYTIKSNNKL
jgi:hypothetical protein